jgi:hypothetical protein
MAVAGLDPVSPPVTGQVQAPPGGRRWAVCRLAVGASDADEAKATAFCRVEGLGVMGMVMGAAPLPGWLGRPPRRRRGRRPGPQPGLDAAAPIAGLPALPPGGAQPPGPTRPGRRGLAAAGLHNPGCGDHGPRRGRPRPAPAGRGHWPRTRQRCPSSCRWDRGGWPARPAPAGPGSSAGDGRPPRPTRAPRRWRCRRPR